MRHVCRSATSSCAAAQLTPAGAGRRFQRADWLSSRGGDADWLSSGDGRADWLTGGGWRSAIGGGGAAGRLIGGEGSGGGGAFGQVAEVVVRLGRREAG